MTLILFHAVQLYRGQLGGIFCLELASWSVLKTVGKKKKKKNQNQTSVVFGESESN